MKKAVEKKQEVVMLTDNEVKFYQNMINQVRKEVAITRDGVLSFIAFEDKLNKILEPHVNVPDKVNK